MNVHPDGSVLVHCIFAILLIWKRSLLITCGYYVSIFLAEKVEKGEARLKFFIGTIEVSDKTYDICNLRPNWNTSCPLLPGNALLLLLLHI